MMNKYNKNEPLIHQLTFPQLFFVYQISKSLENKKILSRLNTESLRYRDNLKFPINIISCQFAMHFFFKSDTYLENIFKVFTPFLKKVGYFFGTTVDGRKIKEQITK